MFETGKIILRHPARADGMRWMANRICLACGYELRSEPRTQPCAQDWN
jgi:hypothetical protein